MVNAMVPVAAVAVQLVPVYQVRLPVPPEEAVNTAPVVTPLLLPSSRATVMTLAARAQEPAVNTRAGEVITSLVAVPAETVSGWLAFVKVPEAMVTVALPAALSS